MVEIIKKFYGEHQLHPADIQAAMDGERILTHLKVRLARDIGTYLFEQNAISFELINSAPNTVSLHGIIHVVTDPNLKQFYNHNLMIKAIEGTGSYLKILHDHGAGTDEVENKNG